MADGVKNSAFRVSMPRTYINLVYDNNGIKEIQANSILNIIDEIETNRLINVYEALNTLIENYSLVILENDIDIVSAEFCYLIIPEGNAFELIPGWVFCSVQTTESDEIQYTEYKYDVVNVVTGKLYPSRW